MGIAARQLLLLPLLLLAACANDPPPFDGLLGSERLMGPTREACAQLGLPLEVHAAEASSTADRAALLVELVHPEGRRQWLFEISALLPPDADPRRPLRIRRFGPFDPEGSATPASISETSGLLFSHGVSALASPPPSRLMRRFRRGKLEPGSEDEAAARRWHEASLALWLAVREAALGEPSIREFLVRELIGYSGEVGDAQLALGSLFASILFSGLRRADAIDGTPFFGPLPPEVPGVHDLATDFRFALIYVLASGHLRTHERPGPARLSLGIERLILTSGGSSDIRVEVEFLGCDGLASPPDGFLPLRSQLLLPTPEGSNALWMSWDDEHYWPLTRTAQGRLGRDPSTVRNAKELLLGDQDTEAEDDAPPSEDAPAEAPTDEDAPSSKDGRWTARREGLELLLDHRPPSGTPTRLRFAFPTPPGELDFLSLGALAIGGHGVLDLQWLEDVLPRGVESLRAGLPSPAVKLVGAE